MTKWSSSFPAAALLVLILFGLYIGSLHAATVTISCGGAGLVLELCEEAAEAWALNTGHDVRFRKQSYLANERLAELHQILAVGSDSVDVFEIDFVWPAILGEYFIDLRAYVDKETIAAHEPWLIENNTIGGELKAIPWFVNVGLLYYRKDLLKKYGVSVPATWDGLAGAVGSIVPKEHVSGDTDLVGFVFQAKPYEGLTCNAVEWIASHGGGDILADDGRVTLDNSRALAAIDLARTWIGTISPREVLEYDEEDAREVFQAGDALFMRHWPHAWGRLNAGNSPVRGKVGVAQLPMGSDGRSAAVLGGSGLAVSKYSKNPRVAVELVKYLSSAVEQRRRATEASLYPTLAALCSDNDLFRQQSQLETVRHILKNNGAVARPSAISGSRYGHLSSIFWNSVYDTLSGNGDARENLPLAARQLGHLRLNGPP